MSCYIIAEAGVNHNGSLDIALQLCTKAKEAGVDAVKFQTFKTEKLILKDTEKAQYQKENTNLDESQFDMIKKLELSYSQFKEIKEHCDNIGIDFLSTPDEEDSLDFLMDLDIKIIKIGSGEITNIPYLEYINSKCASIILSTGMSNLAEVENALSVLKDTDVTLLHCTTNYPCPVEEVNLNAMLTLKNAFKCEIGYSDHTLGIEVPIAAVALGAKVIEKHFTLDKDMEGPDHKASLDPIELTQMVSSIRNIESAMGDGIKKPNKSEINLKSIIQRSLVAKEPIKKGEIFSQKNVTSKRANNQGIPASDWKRIEGEVADMDYSIDDII